MSASFDRMWADLADMGRAASGGYRRFAWTPQDHLLREWFAGECAARGLEVVEDRVGNQWGWWGDPDAASGGRGVVMGSHLDSVPDGGAYDGPLGVVSALAVIDELRARDQVSPGNNGSRQPIAVVNFVDEEGARFGVACSGSRVLAGVMSPGHALGLRDADGLSMAEVLRGAGRDTTHFGADPEVLRRIGAFVELHVEQGRGLVDLDQPVAVASSIWPHGRWRIDLPGQANHAGTTGMPERHDAMVALAEVVLAARSHAVERGCVATIGKVNIEPGGVNAIASRATAWLDSRGADEALVHELVAELTRLVHTMGGAIAQESWTGATGFDAALTERLRQSIGSGFGSDAFEGGVPVVSTGAGHDAGILASAGIPSAMIFVRNPTGVSHSPAEHADREDCHAGVRALVACITDLVATP